MDSSPIVTVGMFRRGMNALSASGRAFSGGRWVLVPPTPEQIVQSRKRALYRHRQVLSWLLLCAGTTLVLGLMPGLDVLLVVHVALDVAFVCYVVFLVRTKQRRLAQVREEVRRGRFERVAETVVDLSEQPAPLQGLRIVDEDETRYLKAGHF